MKVSKAEIEEMMFHFLIKSGSYCISKGYMDDLGITKETRLEDVKDSIIEKIRAPLHELLIKEKKFQELEGFELYYGYAIIATLCFTMYQSGIRILERMYIK